MIKASHVLKGHTRPITQVVFNREGDLLFTASKDSKITLWRTVDCYRMGVYSATGALRSISVSPDSRFLATAGADEYVYIFDVKTGDILQTYHDKVSIVDVDWNASANKLIVVTDAVRGAVTHIYIFNWNPETRELTKEMDVAEIISPPSSSSILNPNGPIPIRVTQAKWGPLDKTIFVTTDKGEFIVFSYEKKTVEKKFSPHSAVITSLVFDRYKLLAMTSSKDGTAILYNARLAERIKSYKTGRPINACSISPVKDEVLLGGGQEARDVTTTSVDQRQFMAHFYDLVHQNIVGLVKGHFSPINCASYSPDGRFFVTGGEDGNVHLYAFGKQYFDKN